MRQAPEDVGDCVSVYVKFCNIAADVLLAGVSQELQVRPISPEESAILCDPVQRDRGVVKEVDQLLPLQLLAAGVSIRGRGERPHITASRDIGLSLPGNTRRAALAEGWS